MNEFYSYLPAIIIAALFIYTIWDVRVIKGNASPLIHNFFGETLYFNDLFSAIKTLTGFIFSILIYPFKILFKGIEIALNYFEMIISSVLVTFETPISSVLATFQKIFGILFKVLLFLVLCLVCYTLSQISPSAAKFMSGVFFFFLIGAVFSAFRQ